MTQDIALIERKRPQRALVIGCGAACPPWFEAARRIPGLEIVGIADLDEARAEQRAAQFGLTGAITAPNLYQLLARTQADIVFDIVTPDARPRLVKDSLHEGCHVLSEMPTWTKEAPGPEYVRPAAGQVFCVMLNGRYRPGVQRIKALLASGVIGQVTSLHCDVFTNSEAGAFHEGTKHPLLFNMAVHSFDTAQVLAGRNARAVTCREWNPIGSRHDKASSAMAVFEMGGRIIFTYRGSCCANAFPTSPYGAWRITCTGGSLLWDGEDDIQARTSGAAGHGFVEIPPPVPDEPFSGHLAVMRDFIAATRGGPEPDTHRSQHRTHAMLFAAAESSERGRRRALSGGDSVIAVCAPPPAYR